MTLTEKTWKSKSLVLLIQIQRHFYNFYIKYHSMFSHWVPKNQAQLRQNLQPTASAADSPAASEQEPHGCWATLEVGRWRWLRMGLLILETMIFPIFYQIWPSRSSRLPIFPTISSSFSEKSWKIWDMIFPAFYHHFTIIPAFYHGISTGTTNNEAKCGPNGPSCNVWWRPPRPDGRSIKWWE